MKISRALVLVLLLAAMLALVSCSSGGGSSGGGSTGGGYGSPPAETPAETPAGGDEPASATTVIEKNFAFDPASIEVKVGDTVTFTNEDSAPHNVAIDGKNLGDQNTGASVTWKAEKAGTYAYTCTIHPSMTGEVVVK